MNGRVSRLILHIFPDKSQRRRFKKAYNKSDNETKRRTVETALKINQVRKDGGKIHNINQAISAGE